MRCVQVVSGNYVTAKRRGIIEGIDYGLTGEVRGKRGEGEQEGEGWGGGGRGRGYEGGGGAVPGRMDLWGRRLIGGLQFWTVRGEEREEAEGEKAGFLCALVASVCCTANELPTLTCACGCAQTCLLLTRRGPLCSYGTH